MEIPGFVVDILKPNTHQYINLESIPDSGLPIEAHIVMMCGCPIEVDGIWDSKLIEVKNDDLLTIRSTGAYSSVMRSNYNARVDAVEILIHNGKPYQLRKIDTIQEIISKEKINEFF